MTKWKQRRDERKRMRDELAAKAMQGLLASSVNDSLNEFAKMSYRVADAMLKARSA